MTGGPLRVTILYDLDTWVLGYITRSLKEQIEPAGEVSIEPLEAPRKRAQMKELRKRFDVIHFMSPGDFYRLGPATAAPSVVTVHHVATRVRTRLNETAALTDVLCCINKQCEEETRVLPGVKGIPIYRTPFGVNLDYFRPNPEGRQALLDFIGCPPETVLLALSAKKDSNEDERKGFDRYTALMKELKGRFGNRVRLMVFGPGPEAPFGWQLTDFPEEIRDLIVLPGFLPAEKIPLFYSGLDFYVCLSRNEGGPYPVMENMACGVRTISTVVGIVDELIEDGVTGYLVDEGNYLEKIPRLIEETRRDSPETEEMGRHARETIRQKRGWPTVVSPTQYAEIYRLAIERYNKRPLTHRMQRHFRENLALAKYRLRGR